MARQRRFTNADAKEIKKITKDLTEAGFYLSWAQEMETRAAFLEKRLDHMIKLARRRAEPEKIVVAFDRLKEQWLACDKLLASLYNKAWDSIPGKEFEATHEHEDDDARSND